MAEITLGHGELVKIHQKAARGRRRHHNDFFDGPLRRLVGTALFLVLMGRVCAARGGRLCGQGRMNLLALIAGVAEAEKFQAMGIYPEPRHGPHFVVELLDGGDADVVDAAAIFADEMVVGVDDGVKVA